MEQKVNKCGSNYVRVKFGKAIMLNCRVLRQMFLVYLKANRKLIVLTLRFLSLEKRRNLFKAFLESQFSYFLLIWMFHKRQASLKIYRLHQYFLRKAYNDNVLSFQDLLNTDNSFTIQHQNIQSLATEIFKTINNLPGATFEGLFTIRTDSYSFHS